VPAFKDDYVTLCDSSVICDYLENRYPKPALYPKSPLERARGLWLEEFADTELFVHLGPGLFFEKIVAPVMFRRPSNEELIQKSIRALPPLLDYLERDVIPATGFLLGTELCIADLILPGVFLNASYANYHVDENIWPRLAAYLKRSWAHPLYQARIAEEQQLLAAMQARLKK
jgi:glutathione S-transferase